MKFYVFLQVSSLRIHKTALRVPIQYAEHLSHRQSRNESDSAGAYQFPCQRWRLEEGIFHLNSSVSRARPLLAVLEVYPPSLAWGGQIAGSLRSAFSQSTRSQHLRRLLHRRIMGWASYNLKPLLGMTRQFPPVGGNDHSTTW